MRNPALILLPISFVAALLAVGFPYWQLPYNTDPFSQSALWPGLVLLGALPAILIAVEAAKARWIMIALALCLPAIDWAIINRDTAIDPTDHNLWPLELAYNGVVGVMILLPGMIVGLILRTILRRRAA